jgi:hypothetical protein
MVRLLLVAAHLKLVASVSNMFKSRRATAIAGRSVKQSGRLINQGVRS